MVVKLAVLRISASSVKRRRAPLRASSINALVSIALPVPFTEEREESAAREALPRASTLAKSALALLERRHLTLGFGLRDAVALL